jgi:integrase
VGKRSDLGPTKYPGIYTTKGGHVVRARARDPRTGKEVDRPRFVPGSLRDALRVQAEMRSEVRTRGAAKRTKVAAYAESWLARKSGALSIATLERYRVSLEEHILPVLGEWYIDALTPDAIVEWRGIVAAKTVTAIKRDARGLPVLDENKSPVKEERPYGARTVNGWLRVLKTMLADACVELRIAVSPASRVQQLPEPPVYTDANPNLLSPEQLAALLVALPEASPSFWPLVCTLGLTALRTSEATGLKRADYVRSERMFEVHRSAVRGNIREKTKTGLTRRVPVPAMLAEVLDKHIARLDEEARVESVRRGEIVRPSEWLFPSDTGEPRYGTTLAKPLRRAMELAGITMRLTPHGLRRSINDALRAVASAEVQKAITGHTTERMREHYSHVRPEERAAAIEKVAAVIRLQRGGSSS